MAGDLGSPTPPPDIVDRVRPLILERGDLCDARNCGARAYVFADFIVGSLAYCAHHGTEYLPRLRKTAVDVQDYRHLVQP